MCEPRLEASVTTIHGGDIDHGEVTTKKLGPNPIVL